MYGNFLVENGKCFLPDMYAADSFLIVWIALCTRVTSVFHTWSAWAPTQTSTSGWKLINNCWRLTRSIPASFRSVSVLHCWRLDYECQTDMSCLVADKNTCITLLTPIGCHMGTAIKHPMPDWVMLSCVIFDIRALWQSGLSIKEFPDVKNYKWRLNPVWHRMFYSCSHTVTVGDKGLTSL